MGEPARPLSKPSPASVPMRTSKGIPPDRARRDELVSRIAAYVRQHRPIPPLTFDELNELTDGFLADEQTPAGWRSYVAVLMHNEVWRETLAKVPFDRRVLLSVSYTHLTLPTN